MSLMNDPLLKKSNCQTVLFMLILCAVYFYIQISNNQKHKEEPVADKNEIYSLTLLSRAPEYSPDCSSELDSFNQTEAKESELKRKEVKKPALNNQVYKAFKTQRKVLPEKKEIIKKRSKSDVYSVEKKRKNDSKTLSKNDPQSQVNDGAMKKQAQLPKDSAKERERSVFSLLSFLQSKRKYPKNAIRHNIEGECVLRISINSNGIVEKSILEKESSYSVLNNECKRLSSIVTGFNVNAKSSMSVIVPVRFLLNE